MIPGKNSLIFRLHNPNLGKTSVSHWHQLYYSSFHSLLYHTWVLSDLTDEEDNLLQGLNSYRNSLQLPALAKNKKAECLANEVADKLEDKPCIGNTGAITTASGPKPQIPNYPDLLKKCDIDPNTTTDGVILPVCVPNHVQTLVLTNYTHTQYTKYLNNSKYTGAGVGSEDDWMVVVLTTNTPSGSFASTNGAGNRFSRTGLGWCWVFFVLGVFLVLLIWYICYPSVVSLVREMSVCVVGVVTGEEKFEMSCFKFFSL